MTKLVVDTAEIYDTTEAARLLGIGYATLYRWIKDGKLIPLRISGRTLIPKSEVERLKSEAPNLEQLNSHTATTP
jgi:excisionase family DNA binding protein